MTKRISSFLILAFTVFATAIGSAHAAQSSQQNQQQSQQPVLVGSDTGPNNPAADGDWWKD